MWQGAQYEGLTCNVLEWIASSGGGAIIEDGVVTLDNPDAVAAIERAVGWIETDAISPPDVLTSTGHDSLQRFLAGDALFLRHWTYVYARSQREPELVGNVGVALLPAEPGEEPAGTLGGWNFGVTTDAGDPTAAAAFVAFVASEQEQRNRAVEHSYLPALVDLYDEADVQSALPTFDVRSALTRAVARPSDDVGTGSYDAVSELIYGGHVHNVLDGDATAEVGLADAQAAIENETGLPGGTP
jgi:trehalose/maltose transport system substrate-binding protein